MEKRWFVKTPKDKNQVEKLRSELKVNPIVAELLLQRGISSFEEAERFFRPQLSELHDPFLMKNMEKAVERLEKAIKNQEKVLLFGDYDVDGTTAVALMYRFLQDKLHHLSYYIPDRYSEGYGVSEKGIQFAIEKQIDLIITLDCGVKAVEKIELARKNNLDVIVCDHHEPGDILPDAIILDPKQENCNYPFKELSGCGVGFKLLQGWCQKSKNDLDTLFQLLDFLAISIGADIVSVTGENRVLAFYGLKQINENTRTVFAKMLTSAKKELPVTLTDIVFSIAPRINAAGRLDLASKSVELMLTSEEEKMAALVRQIEEFNQERREIDAQITAEALKILEKQPKSRTTNVVFDPNWHKGVVGIVASKIQETHYKPTIVLTQSNGNITGSARSVKGFDIHKAMEKCADLLTQFGGHKYAAGLTMKEENVSKFIEKFEQVVADSISKELLIPEQKVDLELHFQDIFTVEENRMKLPRLKRILQQFEPHGPDNMKPVFLSKNVFTTDYRLLKDVHLKLQMTQPNSDVNIDGIGFFLGEKKELVAEGMPYNIAYTLEVNRWKGREILQLNIKDIRGYV